MRKRRSLLFLSLSAALVLTAAVWAVLRDREPTYDGRTLSEWAGLSPGREKGGSDAIRHMGTNTFPTILKWLRYKPPPWKVKMLDRLRAGPNWIKPRFLVSWLVDSQAEARVIHTYNVLGVLQEEAAPIGPEILRLSYAKSDV